jgi:hypothetical protein
MDYDGHDQRHDSHYDCCPGDLNRPLQRTARPDPTRPAGNLRGGLQNSHFLSRQGFRQVSLLQLRGGSRWVSVVRQAAAAMASLSRALAASFGVIWSLIVRFVPIRIDASANQALSGLKVLVGYGAEAATSDFLTLERIEGLVQPPPLQVRKRVWRTTRLGGRPSIRTGFHKV